MIEGFEPIDRAALPHWKEVIHRPYLYCFERDGAVIYVGQSTHLTERLKTHRRGLWADGVRGYVRQCASEDEMWQEEERLIAALRPAHNIQGNTRPFVRFSRER